MRQLDLGIGGMACTSSSSRVECVIVELDGVVEAPANLATERASVTYDEPVLSPSLVVDAVHALEYSPLTEEFGIGVGGMTCANCSASVERSLNKLPGVLKVKKTLCFYVRVSTLSEISVEMLHDLWSRDAVQDDRQYDDDRGQGPELASDSLNNHAVAEPVGQIIDRTDATNPQGGNGQSMRQR